MPDTNPTPVRYRCGTCGAYVAKATIVLGSGLCRMHGTVPVTEVDLSDVIRARQERRFHGSYVQDESGCWLWTKLKYPNGYSLFKYKEANVLGHRFAYELLVGPIPDDMTVDHLCRVRLCVNPEHMEIVTRGENTRRGIRAATARRRASKEQINAA